MEGRKRFLDPDISLGAIPQHKISKEESDPVPYIVHQNSYFTHQDQFEQFISQNENNLLQYSHDQLQNGFWSSQFQDSQLLVQQISVANFQTGQLENWPHQGPSEPWDQNPQHSPQLSLLSQLQLQLRIPLQFLSTHHDPFAILRLIQLRLLMKPQHLPDPETITSLDGLIGFNRTLIRKILIEYVANEELKEVLKVLEQYQKLHSKRIEMVKDAEFPEGFLVKLYYKYHEIVAKSFEISPNDTDAYRKWMFANINYHVGFRKIGQELQKNFFATSIAEITCFKMEKMDEIRRHKTELDPVFLRGFGEVQKELLDASRQAPVDQSRNMQPDWAHHPNCSGGEAPGGPNLDALGTQWVPEEATTSATYYDNFGSNPWTLEPKNERNRSSEESENDGDNDVYPSNSTSPEALEEKPELIDTPVNHSPAPKTPTPMLNLEETKENELSKLTAILINLVDTTAKLNWLKSRKPETLGKITRQEEVLEEIGKERKEQKERLSELSKLKEEQKEVVDATKKEVELAEKNYQEEVAKSNEFHDTIFAPEISGNILSDASDCIDAMDEDAYNTFLFYMDSRRTLNSRINVKQDTLNNAKKDLLGTENKIKEIEEKLRELRENEEEEIEKMREEEETLEDIEEGMNDLENEKLELEKQRKEQEGIVEQAERDLVLTESKPQNSSFEDEKPSLSPEHPPEDTTINSMSFFDSLGKTEIGGTVEQELILTEVKTEVPDFDEAKPVSQTPSPEHPPELHNEDATINFSSSFDSLDSAPILSPHYPSSPSLSSPSPSPPTDSSTILLSGLGLLPIGQSIDSDGNILNSHGEALIGSSTMDVKCFIPNGTCSAGS